MAKRILGSEGFTHLSEIINDAINGIVAFLLYWPFIWLIFHHSELHDVSSPVLYVFESSYAQLAGMGGSSWIGIFIAVPFIGLLNRAIIYTFIDTGLRKWIFRDFPPLKKISEAIYGFTINTLKRQLNTLIKYLFSWEDVPGNDSERLLKFLIDDLKMEWAENAKIKKSDGDKVITITKESNSLIFKLNKGENKVILEISGGGTYEYILKEEDGKLNIYKDKYLLKIDESLNPCWRLEGSFDFVDYRHWLIKSPKRKMYWDWEHFLDWGYKLYYQTFIVFLILYLVLLIYIASIPNLQISDVAIAFIILIFPIFALYREYIRHHIAWVRMDQRFYVEYLLDDKEKKTNVPKKIQDDLKESIKKEDYKKVNEILEDLIC